MSFAFLALYTGDYLRDTRHLSCCEHGIYLLLLMHCWDSKGPVPLDERKILGICGARSGDEIEAMRRVISEFFIAMDDGHYNRRMQMEIERANCISDKRKSAGIKGFQAKAKHLLSKRSASASTPTPTTTTTITSTTSEKVKNTSRATRFSIAELPSDWRIWTTENRPDLFPETVFDGFRDYWIGVAGSKGLKMDWFATWRNWCRNQGRTAMGKAISTKSASDEFKRRVLEQQEKDITP